MLDTLNQPYPFFHRGRELLRNTAFILILSFFFEYLLEPFNVNRTEHNYDYWVIVLFHSGCATSIYLVYHAIIGLFVFDDDWKIYKEALSVIVLLVLVGSGQFLLREVIYDNPENGSMRYYVEEVRNTMLVGTVLVFIVISTNVKRRSRLNQQRAGQIEISQISHRSTQGSIPIKASIATDHFEVLPSEVLCIRSDGNYLEFYLNKDNKAQRIIKRMTLQSAADQLKSFPFILKTHRAFLVNTQFINKVEGNAQGYQLQLEHLNFSIPVSRGHLENFNSLMP